MHSTAREHARRFAETLPADAPLKILELGSLDANDGRGTLRAVFAQPPWEYLGADIRAGLGIDLVLSDPYTWPEFSDASLDVVVSSSTIEHVARPWRWMQEQARIVRPGGWVYCCVPAVCGYHPAPLDCWRIYPDGLRALFEEAGLVEITTFQMPSSEEGEVDTVGYARRRLA